MGTKPKAKVSETAGAQAIAIYKDLDYGVIWLDGKDVWLARISDDDTTMAKLAEKLFAVAACGWQRVKQPKAWYRGVLQEIDRFYRANGQKPRALKLRPAYGAFRHAVADAYSYLPSQNIEHYSVP